jgi:phage gpG-like protein
MSRGLISVEVHDAEVQRWFRKAIRKAQNPRPLLQEIGEDRAASTKARFGTGTAPDGTPWARNSPLTMARWMNVKGIHTKDGKLNKRGEHRQSSKKPLVGASKQLSHTITYQLRGADAVAVGSPMIYAATHQFGAKMGEFGRYYQLSRLKYGEKDFRRYAGMRQGHPIPWGDIPARPFLGLSETDRANVIDLARRYLGLF